MVLRPFLKFYGGKWRMSHLFPKPAYGEIIEPFCGGAGYSIRNHKKACRLNDQDPVIFGVWDFLISATKRDIMSIPLLSPGESVDDMMVHQEARWLVGFWVNSAVSVPRKSPSKWMRSGIRPKSFWGEEVRWRISEQVGAIKHWTVTNLSYKDVDHATEATWFVDPPYHSSGRHYRHSSEGIDYTHLGAWCLNLPGQVVVCEQSGAQWLPFEPLADTKTARPGARSFEVVYKKGPSGGETEGP